MKYFSFILALCLTGVLAEHTPEEKAKIETDEAACAKETGFNLDNLANHSRTEIVETDEKLACFMACMMKRIGMMNADGTINEEVYGDKARVRGGIPKDKATEILNKCKVMKGNNACQTAMKVTKCLYDEDNKY